MAATTPLLPLTQTSREEQAKLSLPSRLCLYTLLSFPVSLLVYNLMSDKLES